MRYVVSRCIEKQQDMAYRVYLTDSLYCLGRNEHMTVRYIDTITNTPAPDKSGDEVVEEVLSKCGLKRGDNK